MTRKATPIDMAAVHASLVDRQAKYIKLHDKGNVQITETTGDR